jgi:hypothetical protein
MPAKFLQYKQVQPREHRGERKEAEREEGDGREERAAAPLELLQALLLVVEDRVASALCRLFAWLSI